MVNKKAIGIGTFVVAVIVLITIFVVGMVIRSALLKSHETLSGIGFAKCTDSDKQRSVSDFKAKIEMFTKRKIEEGVSYYDPYAAIEQYELYLACKEDPDSLFKPEDIAKYEPAILNAAKTAYIRIAEDLCEEHADSYSKEEQKSIEMAYKENRDKYYAMFPKEKFLKPYGCSIG